MVYVVFKNARFGFLTSQLPDYSAAVANGTVGEFIDLLYARYARRFPIELPLSEDPSPSELAEVDDNAPVPEPDVRCFDNLSEQELAEEQAKITERQALIKKRKRQITTWLSYRHMKSHSCDPRAKDPSNPFTSLLFSLTGRSTVDKPRQKSAVNCWSKSANVCSSINDEVYKICVTEGIRRNQSVAVWNRVAREQFGHLDAEEKKRWEDKAKEEHLKELDEWNALNEGRVSTKPEDRQRCIEGLIRLGQPLIEAMAEATGMNLALYAGGPEPANGGRLSIISLYAGTNNNEDPLNFGQAERADIVKYIFPIFSRFLRNSFTPEECRRRALEPQDDVKALDSVEVTACGGSLDEAPLGPFVLDGACADSSQSAAVAPALPEPSINPTAVAICATSISTGASTEAMCSHSIAVAQPASPSSHTLPIGSSFTLSVGQQSIPTATLSPPGSAPVSPLGSPFQSPTRRGHTISETSTSPAPLPSTAAMTPSLESGSLNDLGTAATAYSPVDTPSRVSGRKRRAQAPISARPAKRVHDETPEDASTAPISTPSSTHDETPEDASTAPTSTPSSTLQATVDDAAIIALQTAHKWFAKAIQMLSDDTLGKEWVDLVAAWVAFEVKFESSAGGLLPCNGRPTAVGDWIARGRNPKWRPKIADSKVYGDAHETWWMFLQPGWRVDDDGVLGAVDGGSWEDFGIPGANGLLSVVASLFFWGTAVKAAGRKSKRWNELLIDTTNILRRLQTA